MTDWMIDERKRRSVLLLPYREKADPPRVLGDGLVVHAHPAPPWVAAVIDALLPRLEDVHDSVIAQMLVWCSEGDPVARAEHVVLLAKLWPGRSATLYFMLVNFLAEARRTKAGRRADTKYKPIETPSIPRAWSDDPKTLQSSESAFLSGDVYANAIESKRRAPWLVVTAPAVKVEYPIEVFLSNMLTGTEGHAGRLFYVKTETSTLRVDVRELRRRKQ